MTLADLITHFRNLTSDIEAPYLWSDDELYVYVEQAQNTMVKGFDGFRDSTSAMTQIVLAANAPTVAIDPRILRILHAQDPVLGPLEVINRTDHRAHQLIVPGAVKYLILGESEDQARPWPVPVVDTAISLTVNRLPKNPIVNDASVLEVRPDHVVYLVQGMLEQAHLKDDPETLNPGKSEKAGKRFVELIAKVKDELNARNRIARPMSYGGISVGRGPGQWTGSDYGNRNW